MKIKYQSMSFEHELLEVVEKICLKCCKPMVARPLARECAKAAKSIPPPEGPKESKMVHNLGNCFTNHKLQ